MKKIVVAFILSFMIAEVNFSAEAALNLGQKLGNLIKKQTQKVGDFVKGRKSNEDTRSLDTIISYIKGLGSSFGSSGSTQSKYISGKFLTTNSDLTFLITYSSFARSSEQFFSLLETILPRIRTEYTTSLGAQSSLEKTTNERKIQKQENKDELSRRNIQRCLEVLMSNGFQALQANLQSSVIVLLKVIQETGRVPDANLETIQKQIDALGKKFTSQKVTYVCDNLPGCLSSASDMSGFSENIDSRTESLVNSISLIRNVLNILDRYVKGENFSVESNQAQIEELLGSTDYYSGARRANDEEGYDDEDYEEEESTVRRPSSRRTVSSNQSRYEEDEDDYDYEDE